MPQIVNNQLMLQKGYRGILHQCLYSTLYVHKDSVVKGIVTRPISMPIFMGNSLDYGTPNEICYIYVEVWWDC